MNNDNLTFITCQTSAAHTFGNVTAQVQKWLLDIFPEKTFKSIHVHSKLAHRQIMSTPKEFLKRSKPMIAIRPRVSWDDKDVFLSNTLMIERTTDLYNAYAGTNLEPFIEDPKSKFRVKYQLNRHSMQFDVILVFSTLMEQMNWMNYIKNAMRIEHPFFISTYLESYLSPDMIDIISECSGVPVHDSDGSVKSFLSYMNSHSIYPITYKLKGSTNQEEFFRYYHVNIDTTIGNLSADDGDKISQVSTAYEISFTMKTEFYSTGFYYIFSEKMKGRKPISVEQSNVLVPIFTDVMVHEDLNLGEGWKLAAASSFKIDNNIIDTINIEPILNKSVKAAVKYHVDNGIPLDMLIDVRVRQQGNLIRKGTDYEIDYKTWNLSMIRCGVFYTYKVLVYVNVKYINELIKDIYNLE